MKLWTDFFLNNILSACSLDYGVIEISDWTQEEVNSIAWDVFKSLLKGLQNLHEGKTNSSAGFKYASKFKSVIHRDIKLKNIGIRRDADGKFYAVIADFGLSTVELDADIKTSDILHRTLPVKRRFLNAIQKLPKSLNWVKYFFNVHSKNVDDEILLIVEKLENVSTTCTVRGRPRGTDLVRFQLSNYVQMLEIFTVRLKDSSTVPRLLVQGSIKHPSQFFFISAVGESIFGWAWMWN